jgi:hypothetical protein
MEALEQIPIDLIHLGDVEGNSVVLRLTGTRAAGSPDSVVLAGEIAVDGAFVSGRISTWLFPEDLDSWEAGLEALADGQSVSWRKNQRATEVHIDPGNDPERVTVTVADRQGSLTSVALTVDLAPDWLEDHRARLESVRERWALPGG